MKFVLCNISGMEIAIDIKRVERILEYNKPTAIPDTPIYVEGIMCYEDKTVVVIDLKNKLDIKEKEIYAKKIIVIIEVEGNHVGVVVDGVNEIIEIDDYKIEKTPEIAREISNDYVKGIAKIRNRIITILNASKIFKYDLREK